MRHRARFDLAREEGFSLVEMLAALALLGLVVAGIYGFFYSGFLNWQKGLDRMDQQQSARIAIDQIVGELRYACSLPGLEFDQAASQVNYTVKDETGSVAEYRFRLAGNEIVHEEINQSGDIVSHTKIALGIAELGFLRDLNNEVQVTVVAGEGDARVSMQSSVRPRNLP